MIAATGLRAAAQKPPAVQVYKDPTCGCCSLWVEHLRKAGFTATVTDVEDMTPIKTLILDRAANECSRAAGITALSLLAAWGEVRYGAARDARHALVITLGTGVGGGIVKDGRIYRGAHGFAAEFGHWQFDPHGARCACGEPGHWEASASGTALGELARLVNHRERWRRGNRDEQPSRHQLRHGVHGERGVGRGDTADRDSGRG